jgi:hypothetical protein
MLILQMGIEYRMDTLLANLVYLQALTETASGTGS